MADRQWFTDGVQIHEEGEKEYFVDGVQFNEDQAEAGPGAIEGDITQKIPQWVA